MSAINKSVLVACVALVAFVGQMGALDLRRCDDNQDKIKVVSFDVEACRDQSKPVCEIPMNSHVVFDVKFNTTVEIDGMPFWSTFDARQPDGSYHRYATGEMCGHLGVECPLQPGNTNRFQQVFYLRDFLVSSAYRVGFKDTAGKQQLCIEMPARAI